MYDGARWPALSPMDAYLQARSQNRNYYCGHGWAEGGIEVTKILSVDVTKIKLEVTKTRLEVTKMKLEITMNKWCLLKGPSDF